MNTRLRALLLVVLTGLGVARATPPPLLSGTTLSLAWGMYARAQPGSSADDRRLQFSAPVGSVVLGTRYDAASNRAVLTYRSSLSAQAALTVAVRQLRRQGFTQTHRAKEGVGQSGAILRRGDRLIDIHVIRGASGNIQTLYTFRDGTLPGRLLERQAPRTLWVYGQPLDLTTVQTVPGRVYLAVPADARVEDSSYAGGRVTLLMTGPQTLDDLQDYYARFFEEQGFLVTMAPQGSGARGRLLKVVRVGDPYELRLDDGGAQGHWRVTFGRLGSG